MADVFISYHEDSAGELAGQIAAALEAGGVSCWYAKRNMPPGADFARTIPGQVKNCKAFLLLINKGSVASFHVESEVGFAFQRLNRQRDIVILPFYVENCSLPEWLEYYLFHVQIKNLPLTEKLVRQVTAALGRKPAPVQPPKSSIETLTPIVQPQIWMPKHTTISAGNCHAVALRLDGTVVAIGENNGGQCNVSDWKDIISIVAGKQGYGYTTGLRRDGTVVAVGNNEYGQCNVSNWRDIVAISSGWNHTIGLRRDGTVVAAGYNKNGECNVSDWRDMVAISAGKGHSIGLRRDGTVFAIGDNDEGQCNVSLWRDIIAISAGTAHTLGLKQDKTVVSVGWNADGQCNVSGWQDIVSVSAGEHESIGLRIDGTVVITSLIDDEDESDDSDGEQDDAQDDEYYSFYISDWKDIVAVSTAVDYIIGLRRDGTVISEQDYRYYYGDITVADMINDAHLTDICLPD